LSVCGCSSYKWQCDLLPLSRFWWSLMRKPATKSKGAPPRVPGSAAAHSRFPVWLPAVLLALATLALYWPATRHDFVDYDDRIYVLDNAHVRGGLTVKGIEGDLGDLVASNWHPLTMLSHAADVELFGLDPSGHHLSSVALHAVNTALVFLLLWSLTGAMWRSVLVAALFGCIRCTSNRWRGWRNARMCSAGSSVCSP
jgi:hypothetical protein